MFGGRINGLLAIAMLSLMAGLSVQQWWIGLGSFIGGGALYFNILQMAFTTNRNLVLLYEKLMEIEFNTRT